MVKEYIYFFFSTSTPNPFGFSVGFCLNACGLRLIFLSLIIKSLFIWVNSHLTPLGLQKLLGTSILPLLRIHAPCRFFCDMDSSFLIYEKNKLITFIWWKSVKTITLPNYLVISCLLLDYLIIYSLCRVKPLILYPLQYSWVLGTRFPHTRTLFNVTRKSICFGCKLAYAMPHIYLSRHALFVTLNFGKLKEKHKVTVFKQLWNHHPLI